ncbi:hypothetical protein CDL12_22947 [Handroanthus impetiginosus]|uniref:Uncharacterized protein n=1 Tax=Handroanthus impetiginosus TaxID=429701 RepID=A0A2G9GGW2_9LAMI|nr:hypothetical protein CDL12_22947 [Handroanthus impetiginosus]
MFKFNQLLQLVLVFILFAQMGKSNFSHARRGKFISFIVKDVTLVAAEKEFAVEGSRRKMSTKASMNTNKETTSGEQQGSRNNKKVSNIGDHKENWKENIMAFSADYRSPKSHPPKNN